MTRKNILLGLLGLFIVFQFFRIDKTNPIADSKLDFLTIEQPPEAIATMFKNACYDCHSNETKYPWYTDVAPFSWWIKNHIDEGRKHLNFSEWGSYKEKKRNHKLEETVEFVEGTEMPLLSYIIAHPEARISEEDRKALTDWVKTIMK